MWPTRTARTPWRRFPSKLDKPVRQFVFVIDETPSMAPFKDPRGNILPCSTVDLPGLRQKSALSGQGTEKSAKRKAGPMTDIHCQCGSVGVELTCAPMAQFFCHCDDCQAAHGAAYIPVAMYPADAVKVTRGNPMEWVLKTMPRITCRDCGTRVFTEPPLGVRVVNAHLLPKGMFQPAFHIQCQFAVRPVKDALPHFKAFPAQFGGSDETLSGEHTRWLRDP